jgi:hypothetical protein
MITEIGLHGLLAVSLSMMSKSLALKKLLKAKTLGAL